MAGNVRFESSSASSEELPFSGSYPNGQRGGYLGATLDRSGSFREGSESRMFSSGASTPRGSASSTGGLPPLSQVLTLDPIKMGDQKQTCVGEVRKILGSFYGSSTEDNCFGAVHSKSPPAVATEELKRFRSSVIDASRKARSREKRFGESLNKLNKYSEAINPKKQQRSEMLTNERSGGSNLLKMGNHIHRNPPDLVSQRLEERNKNVVLNKRVRTSVAEIRAESRGMPLARQQMAMGKDRDILRNGGEGSDRIEEKIRRLPAGGEGWDKKMKRKRSVGSAFPRSTDGDGEPKRVMHHKLNSEPVLQFCDGQGFRSGSSNGGSSLKLDGNSMCNSGTARMTTKNELEKISHAKDVPSGLNKERLLGKGNKLNAHEDPQMVSSSPMTKGKATRTPRSGPIMAANSSPNFPRSSGPFDGWEQPPNMNKIQSISGVNNRKRPLPTGSSSVARWVGQRPQKISRTRRTNLVSPVPHQDEVPTSSEGGPSPDLGSKLNPVGTGSSLLAKGAASGTQQFKTNSENVQSPARLSESEDSGAGEERENRLMEKGTGGGGMEEKVANTVQNVIPLGLSKKNKLCNKEDTGDGVRRQGRSGRASPFSRVGNSPIREKLDSPSSSKPLRNAKPVSDKSGSKSGRPPLKKLSDRKNNRLGQTLTGGSPDFTGESDDDREDLLAAANFACNASYLACSGSFWKRMEPIFLNVSSEDTNYLNQQLKSSEDLSESISQTFASGSKDSSDTAQEEYSLSESLASGDKDRRQQQDQKESIDAVCLIDQIQDASSLCGILDSVGGKKVIPLYQRVLSALIAEDEIEEVEEDHAGRNMPFQYYRDNISPRVGGAYHLNGVETTNSNGIDFEYGSPLGTQIQKEPALDRYACNGNTVMRGTNIQNVSHMNDLFKGQHGLMNSEIGMLPEMLENCVDGQTNATGNLLGNCLYEEMWLEERLLLELQSIGLCPEKVPELADGDNEAVNQDILELQKELHEHVGNKKAHLSKIIAVVQKRRELEERELEQIAMNRLVELAYRKKLATRGSTAARCGVNKVSKQVANAFMKRTLSRCRKFEDTGKSCFSEPALRDILLAPPPRINDSDIMNSTASGAVGSLNQPSDQEFAKTGPILNRGKKKEVLLDDVGGNSSLRAASNLGNTLLGGAKGKRSERDPSKISVAKAGRGERKTKTKPKQKSGQLSTSGNIFIGRFAETSDPISGDNGGNKKKDVRMAPAGNTCPDSSKDTKESVEYPNLPLHELNAIDDLGVANDNEDLSNFLNFDDAGLQDGLQDIDAMGLDIPMDDLSDLNMFM